MCIKMSTHRCVIVGDVVQSREAERRKQLEHDLTEAIANINEQFRDDLVADFARLKGIDELAGVLATPAHAYGVIRVITEAIHPVSIRFAVVVDSLDIEPDDADVATMDGPAFHHADELLDRIETRDRLVGLALNPPAGTSTDDNQDDWTDDRADVGLLADHLDLLQLWKSRWTERQVELVREYRSHESMVAVAESFDITPQTVSEALRRARIQTILEMEARIESAFKQFATEVKHEPP